MHWAEQAAIVISASLFVALCARVTLPLPFTPVPLTLQNFGVLLVGLTLGSRRGFAALALYLIEGASGCRFSIRRAAAAWLNCWARQGISAGVPVCCRPGGLDYGTRQGKFCRAAVAGLLAEVVLFAGGISWLAVLTHSFAQAVRFGLYWFVFAEMIKVMMAAGVATGWQHTRKEQA